MLTINTFVEKVKQHYIATGEILKSSHFKKKNGLPNRSWLVDNNYTYNDVLRFAGLPVMTNSINHQGNYKAIQEAVKYFSGAIEIKSENTNNMSTILTQDNIIVECRYSKLHSDDTYKFKLHRKNNGATKWFLYGEDGIVFIINDEDIQHIKECKTLKKSNLKYRIL